MNTCAALAFLVPSRHTAQIDSIRVIHDKAHDRWMPHINFLFPFMAENKLPDVVKRLSVELSKVPAFVLKLDQIGFFSQKDGNTFHLKATDESNMVALYNAVRKALPEFKPQRSEFHAHLTVGQWKKNEQPREMLNTHFNGGIEVLVDKLCIITRTKDGPFTIHTEISLGVSVEGGFEE
ncbi:2-5 RNA ligase superfamily [uncultured virus]|nr:2-5 RNA ligase superfamily [uncultured virus]